MASDAVQPAGAVAERYAHTERIVFAIFMIVGPLIVLAATIIHPPHGIRVTAGAEYYGAAHDHTTTRPSSTLRTRCSSSEGSPCSRQSSG
jgi:hypothetical protein